MTSPSKHMTEEQRAGRAAFLATYGRYRYEGLTEQMDESALCSLLGDLFAFAHYQNWDISFVLHLASPGESTK